MDGAHIMLLRIFADETVTRLVSGPLALQTAVGRKLSLVKTKVLEAYLGNCLMAGAHSLERNTSVKPLIATGLPRHLSKQSCHTTIGLSMSSGVIAII